MKVDMIDNIIIVYLRDINSSNLEDLCEEIINKLKKYYNVELKGFYDVHVYSDESYGTIMEFVLEDLDLYYDYSKVDLHIISEENTFLLQIDDILDINADSFYLYQDKYYITLDKTNIIDYEFGRIVYRNTDDVLSKGIMCKVD